MSEPDDPLGGPFTRASRATRTAAQPSWGATNTLSIRSYGNPPQGAQKLAVGEVFERVDTPRKHVITGNSSAHQ